MLWIDAFTRITTLVWRWSLSIQIANRYSEWITPLIFSPILFPLLLPVPPRQALPLCRRISVVLPPPPGLASLLFLYIPPTPLSVFLLWRQFSLLLRRPPETLCTRTTCLWRVAWIINFFSLRLLRFRFHPPLHRSILQPLYLTTIHRFEIWVCRLRFQFSRQPHHHLCCRRICIHR